MIIDNRKENSPKMEPELEKKSLFPETKYSALKKMMANTNDMTKKRTGKRFVSHKCGLVIN